MAEETTLEKMERLCRARNEAQRADEAASELLKALASGSAANIAGIQTYLSPEGDVILEHEDRGNEAPWRLTIRQFRGLMGWGRKHVGDGPNGKSKDEP